jgi:DNA-binding IclR family transcriptional regulator
MGRASKYDQHRTDILSALAEAEASHARPPTVRSLADGCGVGVATMHSYLTKLSEEGVVEWKPKSHRSLRLRARV